MNAAPDPRRGHETAAAGPRQGESRRRFVVEPAFRATYNQITEAHRVVVIPRYFWVKWVPILGPVAAAVYMQLRQHCYHNPETGETRDQCWPRQSTLAVAIGIKDTKTIRKALVLLEQHGFITREAVYRREGRGGEGDTEAGRAHRGTDRIAVHFEIPLTEEDQAAAMSMEASVPVLHIVPAVNVDNSAIDGNSSRHIAGEKIPSRTSTRTSTSTNVRNVRSQAPSGQGPRRPSRPRRHPHLDLAPEERERRESLALFVGDQLAAMAGSWDPDGHRSAGFHRKVVLRLDECQVHEALAATRDAVDDSLGKGRPGRARPDPAAYFAGAVRRIAEREGIDLGVRWGRTSTSTGEEGTDRWAI